MQAVNDLTHLIHKRPNIVWSTQETVLFKIELVLEHDQKRDLGSRF